jgi:hypothetical protein
MGHAKQEKKLRKALAKGLKKALKTRAKGDAPPGLSLPLRPLSPRTDSPRAPGPPGSPAGRRPGRQWGWLLAGAALSLPSVVFVPLHQLVLAGGYFPGGLPDPLVWATFLTGRFGPACTLVALGMAVGASLSGGVRRKAQAALWLAVTLSGLACCYAWQVPA